MNKYVYYVTYQEVSSIKGIEAFQRNQIEFSMWAAKRKMDLFQWEQ